MYANDFPIMDLCMAALVAAFFIGVLYLVFRALSSLLHDPYFGGLAKGLWLLLIVLAPFVGVVAYVVVSGYRRSEHGYETSYSPRW